MRLTVFCIFISALVCAQPKKNEWLINMGYSQAAQTLYPLVRTSNWNQNIHNGFGGIEYYRNGKEGDCFGIGLQMVEKGFQNGYTIQYPSYSYKLNYFFKFDYLEAPVMYRYIAPAKFGKRRFFFNLGFAPAYMIKSAQGSRNIRDYHDGRIQYSKGTSYNPAVFRKWDVSFLARVGYEFRRYCNVNFTFTQGLVRPYIYGSGELNYNTVFMVSLSYNLHK